MVNLQTTINPQSHSQNANVTFRQSQKNQGDTIETSVEGGQFTNVSTIYENGALQNVKGRKLGSKSLTTSLPRAKLFESKKVSINDASEASNTIGLL